MEAFEECYLCLCTDTHTQTYTHTETQAHTNIHTDTHTDIHTHTETQTHTQIHRHTGAHGEIDSMKMQESAGWDVGEGSDEQTQEMPMDWER